MFDFPLNQVELDEGIIQWEVGTTKNKRGRTLAYDGLPGLVELRFFSF